MEGAFFSDTFSVEGAIANLYGKLYREDHPGRPLLEGISYESISSPDACDLVKEFLEEEVWNAINDLGKEKDQMASILLSFNIVRVLSRGRLWVYFLSSTQKVFVRKA